VSDREFVYQNPDLILASSACINYVITHDLCHFVHASTGPRYDALMRRVMPHWQHRKERLEQTAAGTRVRG
jgi:predicted metal-dependent hydrolase